MSPTHKKQQISYVKCLIVRKDFILHLCIPFDPELDTGAVEKEEQPLVKWTGRRDLSSTVCLFKSDSDYGRQTGT